MIKYIEGSTANELFVKIAQEIINNGKKRSPRGLETREIDNIWLTLTDISKNVVTLPERKLNRRYLTAELEWYLRGDRKVDFISEFSSFWKKIADKDGKVNSNYGHIALVQKNDGITQLGWCLEKLTEDPQTRQAVINYNQPKHKYEGNKDFVCTLNQLFKINDENKLESTVMMRSNDLIYGLSYDLPWFTLLQKELADKLGIETGNYNHFAASMHVYKRHYDMLDKISKANPDYCDKKSFDKQRDLSKTVTIG